VPFKNDIIGGAETLIREAIRSPNYVAGSSGWTVNKDGTVEFNSGVFRGTITAGTFQGLNFIIDQSGIFFYSGTPASGNLILAFAPSAGTDTYGNSYGQGLSMASPAAMRILANTVMDSAGLRYYDGTPALGNLLMSLAPSASSDSFTNAFVQGLQLTSPAAIRILNKVVFDSDALKFYGGVPAAGNLRLALAPIAGSDSFGNAYPRGLQARSPGRVEFPALGGLESDPGNITADGPFGTAPAQYTSLYVNGPKSNGSGATDQVQIAMFSANHDNTSNANMGIAWLDNNSNYFWSAVIDRSGFQIWMGFITALQPGTGGTNSPGPAAEVWHDFGSLSNSWSKTAGFNCRYRMMGDHSVRVEMANIKNGTTTDGTVLVSAANSFFDSSYRPGSNVFIPIRGNSGGNPAINCNTDGSIQVYGLPAGTTRIDAIVSFSSI
jgi:hypothetical protein